MSLGARLAAALGLLLVAAAIFALLASLGVVPKPGSVMVLARQQTVGRSRIVASGYYITPPSESMGGPQLPPYIFSAEPRPGAPGVYVAPDLDDVTADKVAVMIDTSTGDGTQASPFVIHTIARWGSFVTAVTLGVLIAAAFALWLAGTVVALLRHRR